MSGTYGWLAGGLFFGLALAASPARAAPSDESRSATDVTVPDVELLDQNGVSMRFRRDVVGDHIVVVDFVSTRCTTLCPMLTAILSGLQQKLGDRLGKDVWLVSVSIDPVNDTPPQLKAYASTHHAGSGWVWLAGRKESVERLLRGLGASSTADADHTPTVLVGDGRTGQWSRFDGFPLQGRVLRKVDELVNARGAAVGRR